MWYDQIFILLMWEFLQFDPFSWREHKWGLSSVIYLLFCSKCKYFREIISCFFIFLPLLWKKKSHVRIQGYLWNFFCFVFVTNKLATNVWLVFSFCIRVENKTPKTCWDLIAVKSMIYYSHHAGHCSEPVGGDWSHPEHCAFLPFV